MASPIPQELSINEYNNECTISLEAFQVLAARKDLVVTSCGHKFSRIEIMDWLTRDATCPLCRRGIDKEKLISVVLATNEIAKALLPADSANKNSAAQIRIIDVRQINGTFTPAEALKVALDVSLGKAISGSSVNPSNSSSSSSSSSSKSSSARSKTDKSKVKDLARIPESTPIFVSFRELEQPSLSHESIEMLAARAAAAESNIIDRHPLHHGMIESRANLYLRTAFILRITKEDGAWEPDVLISKMTRLITEIELTKRPITVLGVDFVHSLKYYVQTFRSIKNDPGNSHTERIVVGRGDQGYMWWKYASNKEEPEGVRGGFGSINVNALERNLPLYNRPQHLFPKPLHSLKYSS